MTDQKRTGLQQLAPLAVSAKQLAAMLNMSERKIRMLDASGKIPRPVTIGARSVRWPVPELRDWLRAGAPDRKTWQAMKRNGTDK